MPSSSDDVGLFEKQFIAMFDKHQSFLRQNQSKLKDLETLYIGGGTPSLWGERGAKFLTNLFQKHEINLLDDGEFTLEVNPGTWTEEGIRAWQKFGVNRFSLGIQSLRSDYLKVLDRVHSVEDVLDTLTYFNKRDLNFSVDFMLGLPKSEMMNRDVLSELEEILQFSPQHISLYILTAKSNYKLIDELPNELFLEKEFLAVASYLKERGFDHYEVSNFAKPGQESIHNLRYWQSKSVAALGPSAVGLLSDEGIRYKWKARGAELETELLNPEQLNLERLYMAMRTNLGFGPSKFFKAHREPVEKILKEWQREGLGAGSYDHFCLNSKGLLILDSLIERLLNFI